MMEYGMRLLGNDAGHDNKQLLILNYFLETEPYSVWLWARFFHWRDVLKV